MPAVWDGRGTHYWPFLTVCFLEMAVQEGTSEANLSVMLSEEEMGCEQGASSENGKLAMYRGPMNKRFGALYPSFTHTAEIPCMTFDTPNTLLRATADQKPY